MLRRLLSYPVLPNEVVLELDRDQLVDFRNCNSGNGIDQFSLKFLAKFITEHDNI